MAKKRDENLLFQPLTGMILDDQARLSFEELCEICDISAETIVDMIEEGLLEPQGRRPGNGVSNAMRSGGCRWPCGCSRISGSICRGLP